MPNLEYRYFFSDFKAEKHVDSLPAPMSKGQGVSMVQAS